MGRDKGQESRKSVCIDGTSFAFELLLVSVPTRKRVHIHIAATLLRLILQLEDPKNRSPSTIFLGRFRRRLLAKTARNVFFISVYHHGFINDCFMQTSRALSGMSRQQGIELSPYTGRNSLSANRELSP